jgi:hypothetical protein
MHIQHRRRSLHRRQPVIVLWVEHGMANRAYADANYKPMFATTDRVIARAASQPSAPGTNVMPIGPQHMQLKRRTKKTTDD